MKILQGYSELASACGTSIEYAVKGIDWNTRFIRPYRCRVIKVPPCVVKRVCTGTYSSMALPWHRFLANPLPYPFSSVPLKSLVHFGLDELRINYPVAVAPIAMVSNNPHYSGGIISDHVITFAPINSISVINTGSFYDIELLEGDNYILNNTVRVK